MTIPQTVIDPEAGRSADELIAPLVMLVERHGLKTRVSSQGVNPTETEEMQLALISFPDIQDALEFCLHTAHESEYTVGEHLALSVHRPLGPNEGPTGTVRFLPEAIPYITLLWTKILQR